MIGKRLFSVLFATGLIMIATVQNDKGYDATDKLLVNTDLMVLTVATLKQVDEQVQECSHKRNCDK